MATKKPKNPKEAKLKYYSPDGNYKTKITKKYGEDEKVKETRTLKGVLRGVNKPSIIKEEPKAEPKLYQAKKGGLVKKQDGGIPGWQAKSKSVKNTEWQKAKVPSSPFSVVPPNNTISKPKPKPNWVSPPASKDTKKKGGAIKNKNWIQDATASIKRRGTAGKCTPITKPGCTGKAKALAKTFKKIAKNR
jgi:hypothetical protein